MPRTSKDQDDTEEKRHEIVTLIAVPQDEPRPGLGSNTSRKRSSVFSS